MKDGIGRALRRYQQSFAAFSAGQKVVAVVGTAALLLAGFMVFRWAAAPSYAPLFTNLSAEDASAVVEQLNTDGIPYEIGAGGSTISVPQADVYSTRISLSGDGLPANSGDGGYSLLDTQDISTSEFKEQTDFKRAMEGELSNTIEAIDGVNTAVVHLALPPKEVFAEEQAPATASVLVDTQPGSELGADQVQAIVHLVASSIDGLDPTNVTVADAAGRVLTNPDGEAGMAGSRQQMVEEYQNQTAAKVQAMLDRVLGPGNSTVTVSAALDFDKAVTNSTTYTESDAQTPISESSQTETYTGGSNPAGGDAGGVVGADGQMDGGTDSGDGNYNNEAVTRDNPVDVVQEQRESSPGDVDNQSVSVAYDVNGPVKIDPNEVEDMVAAAAGVDLRRGDSIQVSAVPFDTSLAEANEAALKEAEADAAGAQRMEWIRNGGLILLVALLLLLAWLRGRKHAKARQEATTYVVEQLRNDAAERAAVAAAAKHRLDASPATMALQSGDGASADIRDELSALVERQPEEVAALLRGWLVERH